MVGLEQTRASVSAGDLAAASGRAARAAASGRATTRTRRRRDDDDDDDDETRDSRARFESALRGESAPPPPPRPDDAGRGGRRALRRARVSRVSMKDGSITLVGGTPPAPRGDAPRAARAARAARTDRPRRRGCRSARTRRRRWRPRAARDERLAGAPLRATGPRVGQAHPLLRAARRRRGRGGGAIDGSTSTSAESVARARAPPPPQPRPLFRRARALTTDGRAPSRARHRLTESFSEAESRFFAAGALLFSAGARGERLFGAPHRESSALFSRIPAPLGGAFFAGGVIAPDSDDDAEPSLLSSTGSTVVLFGPRSRRPCTTYQLADEETEADD